ncbi:aminoglycoside adenylyltransferase domain-containing protein [Patulibacter sp. SYSU D01012]|uniref:aminoglycoside adenylyltransferase domain-containing protein n=1 Tax=Patulibacter sp. SYSU D01012 TaxID=2817381 RepID=UPI001B3046EE|nr:aminoglycoside adenylyltransferase domain-containing protein [Patulibacter sp. SYSU D01012]
MIDAITPILEHLDRADPGGVLGVYLYGSAVTGGLRPNSDLDLLVITRRSLTRTERAELVSALLHTSGPTVGADPRPETRRPIELTSLVAGAGTSWEARAHRDFQYGEWLRAELLAGGAPHPEDDPDAVTLVATAHEGHRVLRGAPLEDLVAPVPPAMLRRANLAAIPDILEEIEGDERNTLLVLSRMLVTLRTGRIVTKDAAADAVAPTLTPADRELLERARDGYLGTSADDWTAFVPRVTALAHLLADRAHAAASGDAPVSP